MIKTKSKLYYLSRDTSTGDYWLSYGRPEMWEDKDWYSSNTGGLLCFLAGEIFALPPLRKARCIPVTEIQLRPGAQISLEWTQYVVTVGTATSKHCGFDWEAHTWKRYHLAPGGEMAATVIKLTKRPKWED